MDPSGSRKSFEQIEVIEHHIIEEGRRPSVPGVSSVPYSSVRNYTEKYETRGEVPDLRFNYTGERDVSREPSFLHQSADYGQQIEISPIRPSHLNTSGSSGHRVEFADTTNNTVINNYGYDVHEIQTSDGGARIVETHGGGPLHESSRLESSRLEESVERPGVSSALRSGAVNGMRSREDRTASTNQIFTVASGGGDTWRRQHEDSESFVRKDSYKKMQISDDVMSSRDQSRRSFVPPSQTSLVSKSTIAERDGCWTRTKRYVADLIEHLRTVSWTPRLMASMCCILLLLLLLLILIGIILNAIFHRYAVSEFLLFPPVCEECRRKNPSMMSPQLPSSLFLHFYSSDQAHFELRGNLPFKSNSFTAVDFKTGYVAIADHALTDSNGRHFVCFIKPLDRSAMSSIDAVMEAAGDSSYEIQSTFGWQEFWQFEAEEIDSIAANSKFTEPIDDCKGAKWYLLRQAVHARDLSCSECYDFCLPDWAVVRKEKYEDESTIGVRRMDCFRLYVPQWSNFRVQTDISGGHWQYPLSSQSTKRDQHATQSDICAICGDKSSGVHYGAVSCYGCKGFFYRAITDNRDFECKLNRRCLVTKDLRCGCRYCRFQKCLHVGMKREAITEKKGAAPSKKLRKEETPKIELSIIERLIEIENRMNEEIKSRYSTWKEGRDKDKVDNDVESLRELSRISLDMLIEWAKTIWPFMELSLEDQCHLLRNYAAQHLILLTAHSESNFNFEAIEKERNLLGDMFVTMQNDEIACRVLDELVYPFRKMQFLNEEYLCFKTFIFLCPDAKYLKEEARKLIQEARTKILGALFSFMTRKHPKDQLCNQIAVRYGRIILLGQAVQRVTQHICQNMKMIRFFGLIELDEALADFIVDLPIEDEKPDEEITECYADNDDLPCCSTSKQINTKTYFEGFDRARIQRIEEELEADGVIENVISQMWEEEDYDVEEESASGYL